MTLLVAACQAPSSDDGTVERRLPTPAENNVVETVRLSGKTYKKACVSQLGSQLQQAKSARELQDLIADCALDVAKLSAVERPRFVHRSGDRDYVDAINVHRFVNRSNYRWACSYYFGYDCGGSSWNDFHSLWYWLWPDTYDYDNTTSSYCSNYCLNSSSLSCYYKQYYCYYRWFLW